MSRVFTKAISTQLFSSLLQTFVSPAAAAAAAAAVGEAAAVAAAGTGTAESNPESVPLPPDDNDSPASTSQNNLSNDAQMEQPSEEESDDQVANRGNTRKRYYTCPLDQVRKGFCQRK